MQKMRWFRLTVAGIILSMLPLYGAVYRSNSLGQKLELANPNESRYTLTVNGENTNLEQRSLYDGSTLIMEETVTSKEQQKEVEQIVYDPLGNQVSRTTTFYENGLPQRIFIQEADHISVILHVYADGRLIETKELSNGELDKLITYYRGKEGMLAGLRIVDTNEGVSQSIYTVQEGAPVYGENIDNYFSTLTYFPHNLVVRNYWVDDQVLVSTKVDYDEAGRLLVTEKKDDLIVKKVYGPDGMMVATETEHPDGTLVKHSYIYDPLGVLDQSEELIIGSTTRRIEKWYKNGQIQDQTEWVDTEPVKATRYMDDGTTIVTLFDNGRPYADITYAPDGKRVLSLEYRKER
ncbi:MAG: hypothetical protein PHX79_08380 [Sphaerochaetaceae bacterium]|nr:hypothetical protein [Sphaerochaetaceae bacterium]MDY0372145.1 hypothetical protein [Sphaerochaetaceae bacterium]